MVKCAICDKPMLKVIDKNSSKEDIEWAKTEKYGMSYCSTECMQRYVKDQIDKGLVPMLISPLVVSRIKL
jgi:hypothetical protein